MKSPCFFHSKVWKLDSINSRTVSINSQMSWNSTQPSNLKVFENCGLRLEFWVLSFERLSTLPLSGTVAGFYTGSLRLAMRGVYFFIFLFFTFMQTFIETMTYKIDIDLLLHNGQVCLCCKTRRSPCSIWRCITTAWIYKVCVGKNGNQHCSRNCDGCVTSCDW